MRQSMMVLAAMSGIAMFGSPAKATEYPYCVTATEGWGAYIERCDFTTMEQCYQTARLNNGTCSTNWRLAFTRPEPLASPVRRRAN